jgi:hypothetical protein
MKKVFLLVSTFVYITAVCRADRTLATSQAASEFYRGVTHVVLTGDNMVLDAVMRGAVEKVWKATPYKIVDNTAFKELRTDPRNSFLLISKVKNSSDKLQRHYLFMVLIQGNAKAAVDIDVMPELSSIPFAGDVTELNEFLLEPVLLFIQKDVENLSNNMFEKRLLFSFEDRMKAYNKNMELLRTKTLHVAQNQIDKSVDQAKMSKQFGENIVFVSELENFDKIVNNNNEKAVLAIAIYPENTRKGIFAYKLVLGLDGTLYYYYRERDGKRFKFLDGDFDMWLRAYKKVD